MHTPSPNPNPSSVNLAIHPWPDPVIDRLGHDPRSAYVEQFWLAILGPSTVLLLRQIATAFDEHDGEAFDLDLLVCAHSLGIRMGGKNSSLMRTINRSCQFGMARRYGRNAISVRRKVPPVPRRHLQRLPKALRERHLEWERAQIRPDREAEQRARQLAIALLESGEDFGAAARQLRQLEIADALAARALTWASQQRAEQLE